MARICREIQERIEETRVDTIEYLEQVKRTIQEKVCEWLPWPADAICDFVTRVVIDVVKVVVTVVTTIVNVFSRIVCEVVSVLTTVGAFIINVLTNVPLIGPLIRGAIRLVVELWSQFVGIYDAVGRLFGIRPTKYLRVCIIILREEDGTPVVSKADLDAAIQFAKEAFYKGAKVRLRVLGVHEAHNPSPRDNLDVNTEEGAAWDELWLPGGHFEAMANVHCFEESFFRLIGLGSPVVVFVVRSVRGQATGCSLLTFTDYVTVERALFVDDPTDGRITVDPTVLAHELGHACTLLHIDDQANLMHPDSFPNRPNGLRGSHLSPFQSTLLRNSRHVTFV